MRAAYLVLAFALLAGLAGCGKGPQGDTAVDRRLCRCGHPIAAWRRLILSADTGPKSWSIH